MIDDSVNLIFENKRRELQRNGHDLEELFVSNVSITSSFSGGLVRNESTSHTIKTN